MSVGQSAVIRPRCRTHTTGYGRGRPPPTAARLRAHGPRPCDRRSSVIAPETRRKSRTDRPATPPADSPAASAAKGSDRTRVCAMRERGGADGQCSLTALPMTSEIHVHDAVAMPAVRPTAHRCLTSATNAPSLGIRQPTVCRLVRKLKTEEAGPQERPQGPPNYAETTAETTPCRWRPPLEGALVPT